MCVCVTHKQLCVSFQMNSSVWLFVDKGYFYFLHGTGAMEKKVLLCARIFYIRGVILYYMLFA